MRKYYYLLLFVFFTVLSLSACSGNRSILEERIQEFDYYTEIIDFKQTNTDGTNFKLMVAYNENSSEVTYIYYMENVKNDFEVILKKDSEIVYEDFIVREYYLGEDFIGEFTGASLDLEEDITTISLYLNPPGIQWSDSITNTYLYHEFTVIKSIHDKDMLYRDFVTTEGYINRDLEVTKDTIVNTRLRNIFFLSIGVGVILYLILLKGYKKLYEWALQKRLLNQPIRLKLLDIQTYKYVSAIILFVLIITTNIIVSNIVYTRYDKVEFYTDYNVNYEETVSDTIHLTYGGTYQFDQNIAFVEKGSTHNIMGYLYITLDDGLVTAFSRSSYGGYTYRVAYRLIQSESISVTVKEWNTDTDDNYLEDVFQRRLYFNKHR